MALDAITRFVAREYGGRLDPDSLIDVASAMLAAYYLDPEHWDDVGLWRLHDTSGIPALVAGLAKL